MALFAPEVLKGTEELARLRGELAVAEKQLKDARAEIVELEMDKRKMMDWVMGGIGMPPLYSNEPTPKAKKPENPFINTSQGRDFSRIATMLENEGLSDTEFVKR